MMTTQKFIPPTEAARKYRHIKAFLGRTIHPNRAAQSGLLDSVVYSSFPVKYRGEVQKTETSLRVKEP